jgi:hypothetical protein
MFGINCYCLQTFECTVYITSIWMFSPVILLWLFSTFFGLSTVELLWGFRELGPFHFFFWCSFSCYFLFYICLVTLHTFYLKIHAVSFALFMQFHSITCITACSFAYDYCFSLLHCSRIFSCMCLQSWWIYYDIFYWTDKDLTYDHLASGLKLALEKDKTALDADRLKNYTGNFFPGVASYEVVSLLCWSMVIFPGLSLCWSAIALCRLW